MNRIVECVPNISEGRNPEIYNAIAKSCEKISGIKLLDIDPGVATNRTVITFAGPPETIVDAAFEVIKASKELIDMRTHKGEHPRMGATDVCPFVPVSNITLEECAELAKKLAKRVGEELGVWTYLYEAAASKPEWKSLPNVRKGEYESLAQRENDPSWKPDFGPAKLEPKFGAVVIGARKFLVAYNINMNSTNKKLASDIAFNIRESGRAKRTSYPDGDIIRNPDGTTVNTPGIFQHCKGAAWIIPEYNCAQITMNLTDIDVTPVHTVFDEVCSQATERGMRVTGSEIVGLVPLQVMLEAGTHYLKKQGLSTAVSEEELVRTTIRSMGLEDVSKFNPAEKIVEYRFRKKGELVQMNLEKFANTLASDAPAPGGGSVAALCGTLASSLSAMVSNLTHGKSEYKESWNEMERLGVEAQKLKRWFLDAIDRDTDSFNAVMEAMKLPKNTAEEKKVRNAEIEKANIHSATVPLEVVEKTAQLITPLMKSAKIGNKNCASDVGVGALCMSACAEGAALNVKINLAGISDSKFKTDATSKLELHLAKIESAKNEILKEVDNSIRSKK